VVDFDKNFTVESTYVIFYIFYAQLLYTIDTIQLVLQTSHIVYIHIYSLQFN